MNIRRVLISIVWPLAGSCVAAQGAALSASPGPCSKLDRTVTSQILAGHEKEAEGELSAALANPANDLGSPCAGLVLANMAALMGVSGRFADAEAFARRAVDEFTRVVGPNAPALLRPLQILTLARLEQGKVGSARTAFQKMKVIPAETPAQRALVHGAGAVLLEKEGKFAEAESEYRATVTALQEDGRGDGADIASALIAVASLYVKDHRLADAAAVLDRALLILNIARDAVPMDRVRLLNIRAVLDARRGDWQKAEEELNGAVSMADRQERMDPDVHSHLLADYARVLRKNHHRRQARLVEARVAAERGYRAADGLVDVSEFAPGPGTR